MIELLNEALATELVCVLRYRHDYFMARGIQSKVGRRRSSSSTRTRSWSTPTSIAERIVQLGGEPDFNPDELTARSHAEYRIGKTLQEADMCARTWSPSASRSTAIAR